MLIADIPTPENLTDIEKIEFNVFKSALMSLENEWRLFKDNKNVDQHKCHQVVEDIKRKRIAMEEKKYDIRRSYIEAQRKSELEKVDKISKEFKPKLFSRIMLSYQKAYEYNVGKLASLVEPEVFKDFMRECSVEFPIADSVNEQPDYKETLENAVDMKEITNDIKQIKEMLLKVKNVEGE